jgi:hypothetical protein
VGRQGIEPLPKALPFTGSSDLVAAPRTPGRSISPRAKRSSGSLRLSIGRARQQPHRRQSGPAIDPQKLLEAEAGVEARVRRVSRLKEGGKPVRVAATEDAPEELVACPRPR